MDYEDWVKLECVSVTKNYHKSSPTGFIYGVEFRTWAPDRLQAEAEGTKDTDVWITKTPFIYLGSYGDHFVPGKYYNTYLAPLEP